MDISHITKAHLPNIIRASEGMPPQEKNELQRWLDGRWPAGKPYASTPAHAMASHLHSRTLRDDKTKFLSFDDMVEALWATLQSRAAISALTPLLAGHRAPEIEAHISRMFPFEADVDDVHGRRDEQGRILKRKVKFDVGEQARAGLSGTRCVLIAEARSRGTETHLQIVSFYPAHSRAELRRLMEFVRSDAEPRVP